MSQFIENMFCHLDIFVGLQLMLVLTEGLAETPKIHWTTERGPPPDEPSKHTIRDSQPGYFAAIEVLIIGLALLASLLILAILRCGG